MAITQSALAHAVARDLVRTAPPEAHIKRVWVWSQHGYVDPERDYVELAVLYDPADDHAERGFSLALAGLTDLHPEMNMSAHTFTSYDVGDLLLDEEIRPGSEEVELGGE